MKTALLACQFLQNQNYHLSDGLQYLLVAGFTLTLEDQGLYLIDGTGIAVFGQRSGNDNFFYFEY